MVKGGRASGALRRGLRLGRLGLGLTGSYLGYQVQNLVLGADDNRQKRFQRQSSRRLREELGSLKGAVMKLGQILSLQTRALPEEVIEELSALQMQAPGMHPTLARAQFKSSLGRYPEEVFSKFETEPFAAASLGQVHRAVCRAGKPVAVKIQYPAIRSAIEDDLKLLRSAVLPARVTGHLPGAIVDEIQRGFLEETDYLHEASNLEFFAQGLKSLDFVEIPIPDRALTARQVLTMSFVEGDSLGAFLAKKPPAALRNLIGERLVELYYHQMHRLRALHADHHPGNFLFKRDGRIGVVDFGCVKRIHFDVSALIQGCVERSWRRGDKEAKEILTLIFGSEVPYARAKRMLPTLELMAGILYPSGPNADRVVDFGKGELLEALGGALSKALQDRITNPEFAFISRAEMGIYSMLHRLGAKVTPRVIWERVRQTRGA